MAGQIGARISIQPCANFSIRRGSDAGAETERFVADDLLGFKVRDLFVGEAEEPVQDFAVVLAELGRGQAVGDGGAGEADGAAGIGHRADRFRIVPSPGN